MCQDKTVEWMCFSKNGTEGRRLADFWFAVIKNRWHLICRQPAAFELIKIVVPSAVRYVTCEAFACLSKCRRGDALRTGPSADSYLANMFLRLNSA